MICGTIWLLDCSKVADLRVHFQSPVALRADTAINVVPILGSLDELLIADLALNLDF